MSVMMENKDFQDLEKRLSVHLQRVQQMRQTPEAITSGGFLEAIGVLEDEIRKMKEMYEKELYKCRREADDRSREKAHYAFQLDKVTNQLMDTEERLTSESDRNRQLLNQLNEVHLSLAQRDSEVKEVRMAMNGPLGDVDRLSRDRESITRENDTTKRRYEAELKLRQESDDKVHQLKQKLEFDNKLHNEETDDLNKRLETAANTILSLEDKIREISDSDKSLAVMIHEVRMAANAEIQQYQEESIQEYNRHISSLKLQIDEDTRKMDSMQTDNTNLLCQVEELTKTIRSLEGEIGSLEHQKKTIEDILNTERHQSQQHIQNLELKLRELQDTLFIKMREINASRDAQIALKAEVEAFRAMLEDEERRLQLAHPVVSSSTLGPSMPHGSSSATTTHVSSSGTSGPVFLPPPVQPLEAPYNTQLKGPVRARSAPASHIRTRANLVPTSLGQGKDYFEEMFKDLKRNTVGNIPKLPTTPADGPYVNGSYHNGEYVEYQQDRNVKHQEANAFSSSSVNELQIFDIHPEGNFVRLLNTSDQEIEIGSYILQQTLGNRTVVHFRFPEHFKMKPNGTVTVWSGCNDHSLHNPPEDIVWKEQQKWETAPECVTILCKPNGYALAWMTAAHNFKKDSHVENQSNGTVSPTRMELKAEEELTELDLNINVPKPEPVYLRREKTCPPSLSPQKHPHGVCPPQSVHPMTGQHRAMTYGNDNSSVNRQSRIQSNRPDPIPGSPYAGASAQKMGSALLLKYTPTGSGAVANKAGGNMRYGQPSPFASPLQQDYARAYDSRSTSLVKP